MGWFWFLGTLVPVIGLTQVGQRQALADRYTYLSLIGIFIMLVWSAADYVKSTAPGKADKTSAAGKKRPLAACAAAAVVGACIIATVIQLGYWRDSGTLFAHAERVSGPNYLARSAMGDILSAEGHLVEAEKMLQSAVALQPHHAYILAALGNCYLRMGKFNEAANCYDEVLQLRPKFMNAHFNLALALTKLGQLDRAMAEYKKVLALQPTVVRAHVELGLLCARKGDHDEALLHFREAYRLDPNSAPALQNLAWTLVIHPDAGKRNGNEAVRLAQRLCELSQEKDPARLNTLAAAYAEIGNYDAAVQTEGEAITLLKASGQQALAEDFIKFQKLYQNHRTCRDFQGN